MRGFVSSCVLPHLLRTALSCSVSCKIATKPTCKALGVLSVLNACLSFYWVLGRKKTKLGQMSRATPCAPASWILWHDHARSVMYYFWLELEGAASFKCKLHVVMKHIFHRLCVYLSVFLNQGCGNRAEQFRYV